MEHIDESISVAAPADETWAVAGDPATIADWVPGLSSSRLEGDVRHAAFPASSGGGEARERIVAHDDAARSYTYEYLDGPLPLEHYRSTISVSETEHGTEVRWSGEMSTGTAEGDVETAEALRTLYRDGLSSLRNRLLGEAARAPAAFDPE